MEAILFTVEFALMTWLAYTIVRRDRGERSKRDLGFFRYKEERTGEELQPLNSPERKPKSAKHA